MSRARILADYVSSGDELADKLSLSGGAMTGAITTNSTFDGIDVGTAVAANTAKTGITSGQASAITANTAKVTNYNQTLADINALDITELGTVTSGNLSNTAIVYPTGLYISRWTNSGTSTLATGVPLELDSQVADTSLFTYSSGLFTCVKAGLYLFCAQFATGTPTSQWVGWAKNYSGAAGSFSQAHFTVRPAYSRLTDTAYTPKLVVNTIRCAVSDVMSVRGTASYAYALDQTSITITYLAP